MIALKKRSLLHNISLRTYQHTPKSIFAYENLYVQISIANIESYTQKFSSQ